MWNKSIMPEGYFTGESVLYIFYSWRMCVGCMHAWSTRVWKTPLKTRFMGSIWGPPGDNRTQVGRMLAPWSLLSGTLLALILSECGEKLHIEKVWKCKGIKGLIQYIHNSEACTMELLILTYWILVAHMYVGELGINWSRQWLAALLVPSHHLYQGKFLSIISIETFQFWYEWVLLILYNAFRKLLPTRWFCSSPDMLTINYSDFIQTNRYNVW